MKALDRKLFRDLWHMRGQVLAIAAVIMGGVATMVMSLSTYDSLVNTRDRFFSEYRFAEVFVSLKRAPEPVAERLAALPGVEHLETRVRAGVKLEVEGFSDPITGQLLSLPDVGEAQLNRLHFKRGRTVQPWSTDEVVLSDTFADAHGFQPGDRLAAIINGKRKQLTVVGVAVSPEYVYQIAPGAMFPDFKRYGVLWMGRSALAAAYDMEGAFNQVSLTLARDANEQDVIDRVDAVLATYGGTGAYGRKNQFSNRFLTEELKQLRTMATIFPAIFLGVAAFLLNVVLSRLIALQREQIAILKAFGYSYLAIGAHYVKLVLLMALLGRGGRGDARRLVRSGAVACLYGNDFPFPLSRLPGPARRDSDFTAGRQSGGGQRHAAVGGAGGAAAAGRRACSRKCRWFTAPPWSSASACSAGYPRRRG